MKKTIAVLLACSILFSGFSPALAASAYEKRETVRVKLSPSGKVKKVTVEDWLKLGDRKNTIRDYSSLKDIINTEGDEKMVKKGKKISWQNKGEDISYKGSCDRNLPVYVKIRYYLDGKRISAKDLAGKTGHVKMRFDYTNNALTRVDGKDVHVPFLCATGVMLPSEHFKKIKTKNARVMESSDQSIVLGVAAPGVKKDLGLEGFSDSDLPLNDSFEIECEARKFELDFTATVVSTIGLDEMDEVNDARSLTSALSGFTNASSKLLTASGQLSDGMDEMSKYLTSYFSGVKKLDGAIGKLNTSLKTLKTQKKELDSQIAKVQKELSRYDEIVKKNADSEDAPKVDALVKSIINDTKSAYEYLEELKAQLEDINDFIKKAEAYKSEVEAYRDSIKTSVEAIDIDDITQKTEELESVINSMELTEEQKTALLNKTGEIKTSASSRNSEKQNALEKVKDVPELDLPKVKEIDTKPLEGIIGTLKSEQAMMDKYDKYLKKYNSIDALSKDIRKTIAQAQRLTGGVQQTSQAVDQICSATSIIKKGSGKLVQMQPALSVGINQLSEGTDQFEKGMAMFDKGARKLSGLGGKSLSNALGGFSRLRKAERSYTNYSGIRSGVKGSVFFIYESDEIKE